MGVSWDKGLLKTKAWQGGSDRTELDLRGYPPRILHETPPQISRPTGHTLSFHPVNPPLLHRPQQPSRNANHSPRMRTREYTFTVTPQRVLPDRSRNHLTGVENKERQPVAILVVRDRIQMGVVRFVENVCEGCDGGSPLSIRMR